MDNKKVGGKTVKKCIDEANAKLNKLKNAILTGDFE